MFQLCLVTAVLLNTYALSTNTNCLTSFDDYGFLVANCSLRNLTEVPDLSQARKIQVLDLSYNLIDSIGNNSLTSFSNLEYLNLNKNKIEIIGKGYLGMDKLKKLNLAHNRLNASSENGLRLIRNIPNIEDLDWGRQEFADDVNKYRYVKYPDSQLQHLIFLRNLSIDLYGDPEFGAGFRHLKLRSIYFNGCYIKHLDSNTFRNLYPGLKEIHLTACRSIDVKSIQTGYLRWFPDLTTIDLSWTEITITKALALLFSFRNKTIDTLNLGHMSSTRTNRSVLPYAVTLTPEMTMHLNTICVKTLILADNNIVDILPNSLFASANLHCLEQIDISGNRFGFSAFPIPELVNYSAQLINLKIFDFSYLPLKYLPQDFIPYAKINDQQQLWDYDSTKKEDIKYCSKLPTGTVHLLLPPRLKYIRISHVIGAPDHKSLKLVRTPSLEYIDMSYYQLRCFPDIHWNQSENNLLYLDVSGFDCKHYIYKTNIPFFKNLKTLLIRDAKLNRAVAENMNLFNLTPKLEILDLSLNYLIELPDEYLISLQNLKNLSLSHNNFRNIPNSITSLPNLTYLDMTGNRLFTIDVNMTAWLDAQQMKIDTFALYIALNDLSCSCEIRNFIRWLNTTKVILDQISSYICRLSNGTRSTTDHVLEHFHEIFANCDAVAWLQVGVVLIVSFFVFLIPIAIFFNLRWRIAFLFYRKFRKIIEQKLNLTYEYDIFVSCSYNGYSWVHEVLLENLEKKWGFQACLEDRDFTVGKSSLDQIAKGIDKSRHIIFVMTSDFMSKPYAAYEIDRARIAKSVHSLQQILVITFDMDIEDVPTEMQSLWSDVSFIEWPKNAEDTQSAIDNLKTKVHLNF